MKKILTILVIILIGFGFYSYYKSGPKVVAPTNTDDTTSMDDRVGDDAMKQASPEEVVGKSVEGRDIVAYHFGSGEDEILFIGGIHGGYEWNSVLVAYELVDYLKSNTDSIPKNIKVTVIPSLNPDGLHKVVGVDGRFTSNDVSSSQDVVVSGRFNANNVDLNRNFDCDWKSSGVWQSKKVSGGSSAFSEPESKAIKDYVEKNKITAVVAWFSSAGGVYASSCNTSVTSETKSLVDTYAKASGYPAYNEFDSYEITGDMLNWFAKINIPAISVLLSNHRDTEWSKNVSGVQAVLKAFAK